MSQNFSFLFRAGNGQPPLALPAQDQQHPHVMAPPPSTKVPLGAAPAQHSSPHQNLHLPGVDMSALAGISPEQIAIIARLFQSGALTLPPAPPEDASVDRNLLPAPTSQLTAPSPVVPASSFATKEDLDMDKEEGELEEDEIGEAVKERDFLRPPPTGPRQRSLTPRDRLSRAQPAYSGKRVSLQKHSESSRLAAAGKPNDQRADETAGTQGTVPAVNPSINGINTASKDRASKAFILALHDAGYTFTQISKEVSHPKSLRRMFKSLGLPLPVEDATSPEPSQNGVIESSSVVPAGQPSGTKRTAAAKPAAPIDRSTYLAKLQAAKNKKPEPTTGSLPSAKPAKQGASTVPIREPQEAAAPPSAPRPAKSAIATDLVKQRLEALKAQQAEKLRNAQSSHDRSKLSDPAPNVAWPNESKAIHAEGQPGTGSIVTHLAPEVEKMIEQQMHESTQRQSTQPASLPELAQTASLPTSSTTMRLFSGLPGLFIDSDAVNSSPTPSQQKSTQHDAPSATAGPAGPSFPLTVPRKRPVAADFDTDLEIDIPASAPSKASKRPLFGDVRNGSENERMIIEVSDDEEEEDVEATDVVPTITAQPFGNPGPLSNVPISLNYLGQASTIAPGTPNSSIDLEKKLKEIEKVKRQIMERETRAKLNGKASGKVTPVSQPAAPNGTLPLSVDTSNITVSKRISPQVTAASERPSSAAALARKQEKARLQQRMLELQTAGIKDGAATKESLATLSGTIPDEPLLAEKKSNASDSVGQRKDDRIEDGDAEESELSGKIESSAKPHISVQQFGSHVSTTNVNGTINSLTTTNANAPVANTDASLISQPDVDNEDLAMLYSEVENDGALHSQEQEEDINIHPVWLEQGQSNDAPLLPEANEANADGEEVEDCDEDDFYEKSTSRNGSPEGDVNVADDVEQDIADKDDNDKDEVDDDDYYIHDDGVDRTLQTPVEQRATAPVDVIPQDEGTLKRKEVKTISPRLSSIHASDDELESSQDELPTTVPSLEQLATGDYQETQASEDLAPELQPLAEKQSSTLVTNRKPNYFMPYESALAQFKDYRYHPDFLDNVSGGFKSLTYSHNIDSDKALCSYEAAGGKCNDQGCQGQHFASMGLSDNDLLKLLGTHRIPVNGPEDEKRWRDGLGAVVRQLRSTNIGRDASAIAARIAAFRREFVGDETRVLNLA